MELYSCTTCGEQITADTRPACPNCLELMDVDDELTVLQIEGMLQSIERELKSVKRATHRRKDFDLNVNSYQYDIRKTRERDASPVVEEGEVTLEYVRSLQQDIEELVSKLRNNGYVVEADKIKRYADYADQLEDLEQNPKSLRAQWNQN